jgi:hypothetical protein
MHQHVAHPPAPEAQSGIIENLSDTLLNAFSRVRKPDERFLSMRDGVDKFEEGLALTERLWSRVRSRTNGEYFGSMPRCARVAIRTLNKMAIRNLRKTSLRIIMTWLLLSRVSASLSLALRILLTTFPILYSSSRRFCDTLWVYYHLFAWHLPT